MKRNGLFNWLAGTALVALVVAAAGFTAISLGSRQPTRVAIPDVPVPQAPAGCRPVAPGSYSAICDPSSDVGNPAAPAPLVTSHGCRPVAPGAYSEICDGRSDVTPDPEPQGAGDLVCRPVAPGALSEICTRR
jgi:hypothetical protein